MGPIPWVGEGGVAGPGAYILLGGLDYHPKIWLIIANMSIN